MSDVMNFIKKNELEVISQILEEKGLIQFKIRQSESESIIEKINGIGEMKIEFLKTV